MKLNNLDMDLLNSVAGMHGIPKGAVNIRRDGEAVIRQSSSNIILSSLTGNKPGLKVEIKPGTRNETVHVPVILTQPGFQDKVYNTFIVGEDADATIIAGCGIHNNSHASSRHDGIHEIIIRRGARLKYIEKHYGEGGEKAQNILNPTTIITVEKGAVAELEMVQIKGVDDTIRSTKAYVHEKGNLKIVERLLTQGEQRAESDIEIYIEGDGGAAQVLSRSVAQENSYQLFRAALIGKTACLGHVECDAIIMDNARIKSIPELMAEDAEAVLTHEAAIGKIAGEQLIKLMSLGLTEKEAVDAILEGFLK
ncbi:SUF system FeS cluster assembly, SufBD [Syntrophomonas zehnderi OL-4]|uniref:SUF system FeS cluster assembly, SufBD n=1 Tax=Syntrophomonas zehnderi OL-4 TaxID=690567 RepID=A0A0E4G9R3_9FIRM|nr:SufD family Fe-S cluster assembly protein [Syntrophomonas zehnderi]CFX22642.1 SUF system FeS cluster assembly, SufBD [Syntrophomonas zehnderi OL-4]